MSVTTSRPVGVDLQENEENRRVVDAIKADNPDLTVRHLPGLVKLSAPGRIDINRASVEALLGRPWETHEFQMAIVSYAGHISDWDDDHIVISWDH
jgi:phenol hydroxylase P2 protein